MTFRERKQFAQIMRALGYPKPLGIDSFDSPNFGVMADLLQWLTALYDPDIVVIADLSSEIGRVDFIRSIVQQMAVRSGVRMNPRKLYASDPFAIRELLKLAGPIYRGTLACQRDPSGSASAKTTTQAPSVQRISQLSSSVPKHSADIYDQLEKELQIRPARTQILASMPPLDAVEKNVIAAVDSASTRFDTLSTELEKLTRDEETLKSKIAQRKHELDRQSKRLMSVQTIRPAFMDEYEVLEQDLQELFKTHFQHYRNVDYLEYEIQQQETKRKKQTAENEKDLEKVRKKVSQKLVDSVIHSVGTTSAYGEDILLAPAADAPGSDDSF
jgi:clusterin-associated protein 1